MTDLLPLLAFAGGVALGLLHFLSLRRVTEMYVSGRSVALPVALQVARLAALGAGLYGLSLLGALPLLAGTLGLLVARHLVLRGGKRGA